MAQIDTFEKYAEALEKADYDRDEVELNDEDTKALQKIILASNETLVKNADAVLQDYYAMKVPADILKQIFVNDIHLAYEAYSNGISDTCQREIIADVILRHIGMCAWPTYGEGIQVMKEFSTQLKIKAKEFNIEIIIDVEEDAK